MEIDETKDLLPCPFCGDSNARISNDDFGRGVFNIRTESWWIQCQNDNCYALQQGSTQDKVIERWNRRIGK